MYPEEQIFPRTAPNCRAVQLDLQPSAIAVDPFYAPLGLSSLQCTLRAASDKDRVQLPEGKLHYGYTAVRNWHKVQARA